MKSDKHSDRNWVAILISQLILKFEALHVSASCPDKNYVRHISSYLLWWYQYYFNWEQNMICNFLQKLACRKNTSNLYCQLMKLFSPSSSSSFSPSISSSSTSLLSSSWSSASSFCQTSCQSKVSCGLLKKRSWGSRLGCGQTSTPLIHTHEDRWWWW